MQPHLKENIILHSGRLENKTIDFLSPYPSFLKCVAILSPFFIFNHGLEKTTSLLPSRRPSLFHITFQFQSSLKWFDFNIRYDLFICYRFCLNNTPVKREKLQVNMNLKDIFAKKKSGLGCSWATDTHGASDFFSVRLWILNFFSSVL